VFFIFNANTRPQSWHNLPYDTVQLLVFAAHPAVVNT